MVRVRVRLGLGIYLFLSVKALGEEELHRVATSVGMKPGHAGKLAMQIKGLCHDHQGSDGGARDEGSAAVAVVDEAEGLQLHLSASASSGYKGVSSIASGRWQARIRCGHNHHNPLTLGTFDTAVEAAVAYAHAVNEGSA